jgi:hypothetical protein
MVRELQKTQQTLFNTLNDSEADPEEFGKYNADVPFRQRSHLSEKNMMPSRRRTRVEFEEKVEDDKKHKTDVEFRPHRGPGAPRTKNKASGLPRLRDLPGVDNEQNDE